MENLSVKAVAMGASLLIGASALVGCAHYEHVDKTEPASILAHEYEAAHTSIIVIPRGKGGISLIPIFHPEQYRLEMQQCDKPQAENVDEYGCVREEIIVSKAQYEQFRDGDVVVIEQ